jgi:hypothetical protein
MGIKLLMEHPVKEKNIFFFPKSKLIDEIVNTYDFYNKKWGGIFDNAADLCPTNIKGEEINVYQYHTDIVFPPDSAFIVCSNHEQILMQLSERKDYEDLSIYLYLNEAFLSLDKDKKKEIRRENVEHINHILYDRIVNHCKKDAYYLEQKVSNMENKEIFACVQLVLTTYCTLNCKECFAGRPHCKKSEHFRFKHIKNELDAFLECIDECIELELIGGEVFLNPYLKEIIQYCLIQDKVEMVQLTSNGTFVPSDEILQIMKNKKVVVAISEYQSVNYRKVERILDDEGINWYGINTKWIPMPDYDKDKHQYSSYGYDQRFLELSFHRCGNKYTCYTILKNKLYVCYRTAMLDYTGDYSFPDMESADLNLPFTIRKERIHAVKNMAYTEGCNYCGMGNIFGFNQHAIEPGEQMK